MQTNDALASSAAARGGTDLRRTLTRVAWWSILLGLIMEVLLLVIRLDKLPQLHPVGEGLGKVTWSLVVCLGLGIGKVLSEDKPFWMGLAGLIAAPLAFTAAQAVQERCPLTSTIAGGPITPALIASSHVARRGIPMPRRNTGNPCTAQEAARGIPDRRASCRHDIRDHRPGAYTRNRRIGRWAVGMGSKRAAVPDGLCGDSLWRRGREPGHSPAERHEGGSMKRC